MKRKLALLLALIMTFMVLAGCNTSPSGSASSNVVSSGTASSDGNTVSGSDDVITLKFAMVDPETSNYYRGAQAIAEEVKQATDGKVQLEIYAGGQLGNERDSYEGAMMGTIDICTVASAVMTSFIPQMAVLDQPFLFASAEEAHAVIDGQLGSLIAAQAETQGIHIVGWMESGFRNVFSVRPVANLSDFAGLKIRTMENDIHMAAFNQLGAIATPMAAGDQFTAFQQGTIDAAENAVANVLANRFYEITTNITNTQHLFVFIGVGVSDKAWNQIPEDLRQPFADAVKRGCDAQRQYLVEANEAAVTELTELGVTFYDIDRDALKEAVLPAMPQFADRMPQEWLDAINADKLS